MINILQFATGSAKGATPAGEVFASPLAYQGTKIDYTSSAVNGEELYEDANHEYYLAYTPVRPGTLRVLDASGSAVSATLVDPYTGQVSGVSDGDVAFYVYDNESVPVQSPMIKMDIKSLPITAQSRKLSAVWSFDAAYELNKEYGADMQNLLAAQAAAEINQEIDNEITLDLYKIANAGPEIVWSRVQPVGVSAEEHYASFNIKVTEGSNEIFAATRRVRGNFIIGGINVDTVLRAVRGFQSSGDNTSVGPHFIGTLPSGIKCYVNPNYDADAFVLGYKGTNMMDAGLNIENTIKKVA